jgi:hypothetical protein
MKMLKEGFESAGDDAMVADRTAAEHLSPQAIELSKQAT